MGKNRSLLEYLSKSGAAKQTSKSPRESSKQTFVNVSRSKPVSKAPTSFDNVVIGGEKREELAKSSEFLGKSKRISSPAREGVVDRNLVKEVQVSAENWGLSRAAMDSEGEPLSVSLRSSEDEYQVEVRIVEGVDVANPRLVKVVRDRKEVGTVDKAFLLDVEYDGERNKAVLVLYSEKDGDLLYWYDRTGHKPYFLTDIPADKVSRILDIVKHPSFEGVEVVERADLLYGVKRYFTKIVTKDPLAVRQLRNKVPVAWEANIRYHVNYIYDLQLVPGIEYRIEGARIEKVVDVNIPSEEEISRIISVGGKEALELAKQLIELFECRWFSPRRIAMDIEVYTPFAGRIPSPDLAEYPIISVAFSSNDGLKKVLVLFRDNLTLSRIDEIPRDVEVEIFEDEIGLILEAFAQLIKYPIVLTFNGDNFDFRYLYKRAQKLGIDQRFMPIKIKSLVKGNKREYQAKLHAALHVDLYKFFANRAIQAYAFDGSYKEFTLDSIASALLGVGKVVLDEEISKLDLAMLVKYNFTDAKLTLELTTFNNELVWKLIILLMRISKLGLEDVTRTTVSVWIKNMFYWEHRRRGVLIPRSEDILRLKGKKVTEAMIKGKKYAGAIVIDPPQGVFFNVVVLDFASLYPSIIMRWNLSYETVDPPEGVCENLREIVDEKGRVIHHVCMDRPGITAQLVGLLRDFRVRIYKKKAKDKTLPEAARNWYDVVQRAMKVYINASYGVFGAETFPLYAPSVSESVTALGRRTIMSAIRKAEELGLIVLYGDTDSLFIWHPKEESLNELRKWVEENFGLELEVDKVYKFVAFALKKNYIGVTSEGKVVIKGMVGKKRNTPDFIKKLFIDIVNDIATIERPEDAYKVIEVIRNRLSEAYLKIKYKLFTLDEVAFKVGLTKPLSEYKRNTPQHVKAALQLKHYGIEVLPGDIIAFVKVKSRDGVKPVQLAKIVEIDSQKYIEALKSALEQLFTPFNIVWEEIVGGHRLV